MNKSINIYFFKKYLNYAFLILLFSSCSVHRKCFFTSDVRDIIEDNKIKLNNIQFYVDNRLTLERQTSNNLTTANKGKILVQDGKNINLIVLKRATPGVCTDIYNDSLHIAFENGNNKYLTFTPVTPDKNFGTYFLKFNVDQDNKSFIYYDGVKYYFNVPDNKIILMIRRSDFQEENINKRNMKGVKIK